MNDKGQTHIFWKLMIYLKFGTGEKIVTPHKEYIMKWSTGCRRIMWNCFVLQVTALLLKNYEGQPNIFQHSFKLPCLVENCPISLFMGICFFSIRASQNWKKNCDLSSRSSVDISKRTIYILHCCFLKGRLYHGYAYLIIFSA